MGARPGSPGSHRRRSTLLHRLAIALIAMVLAVALLASFLASDRPIVVHLEGRTYWLANVIDYDELEGLRGDRLRAVMSRDDWALWTPIRHSPTAVRSAGELEPLAGPSSAHWLGTDDRGRDVAARLVHGTRATATMAVGTALLALMLGLALAVPAALRRRAAALVVASCDVIAAIPALVVVVAAQGLTGQGSLVVAIALVALPRAADTARITLAGLRTSLEQPYCEAARGLGVSPQRVLFRHALPHVYPQLAVATALTAATAVLAEAALSFLGFGTPPPTASWGELLKQAHDNDLRWWLMAPAGVAVALIAGALGALAQPRVRGHS